jgi:hypothetical protein
MAICGYCIWTGEKVREVIPAGLPSVMEEPFCQYLGKMHVERMTSFPFARIYSLNVINDNGIRFDKNIRIGEDRVFNIEYFCHSKSIAVCHVSLYNYMRRVGSATYRQPDCFEIENYRSIYSFISEKIADVQSEEIHAFFADDFLYEIAECFGGRYSGKSEKKAAKLYFANVLSYPETEMACKMHSKRIKSRLIGVAIHNMHSLPFLRCCVLMNRICREFLNNFRNFMAQQKNPVRIFIL